MTPEPLTRFYGFSMARHYRSMEVYTFDGKSCQRISVRHVKPDKGMFRVGRYKELCSVLDDYKLPRPELQP